MTQKTNNNPKQLVEAADLIDSVDKLEKYWGDKYPSSAFSDPSNTDHRYGWGQATTEPNSIGPGSPVYAEDINKLRAQVNSSHYHTLNTIAYSQSDFENKTAKSLIPSYANTDLIYMEDLQRIDYQIQSIDPNKFDLGPASADLYLNVVSVNNGGALWDETLYTEFKYSWSSYQACRYFFNAGGKVSIDLEGSGASSTVGSQDWLNTFDQVDKIYIGAETTVTSTGMPGIGLSFGFYDITSTYSTIFETAVGISPSYAYAYVASPSSYSSGGYYNAQYGGRRIKVQAKAVDTGFSFDVTFKVTLTEDYDDIYLIDLDITCNAGYIQPIDSPSNSVLGSASGTFYKAGAYTYQFLDREAPVITQVGSGWVATGSGINNTTKSFSISPSTSSVSSGSTVTFTVTETTGTMGTGGLYFEVHSSSIPSGNFVVTGDSANNDDPELIPASTAEASGLVRLVNNSGTFTVVANSAGTYNVTVSSEEFSDGGLGTVEATSVTINVT